MKPRSNFLSISATSRLGGIDRVKFEEFCKMIEFKVKIRPRKALRSLGNEMGNRIAPEIGPTETGRRRHALIFCRFF